MPAAYSARSSRGSTALRRTEASQSVSDAPVAIYRRDRQRHIFLANNEDYRLLIDSAILSPETIGHLYQVPEDGIEIFALEQLLVVKISFPRLVTAGSFEDRDLHAGQQHIPLSNLGLPIPRDEPDEAAVIQTSP